jgi:6-phosphogluconolactonase (cycloisomerase 2 family)
MTFVTLSGGYVEPNIGVGKEFFAYRCGWIPEVFLGEVMRMKVRALLSSFVVLATMSLVGCGHYTCGTTFGNATCTSSGGGISQGGGGTSGSPAAFDFFLDSGSLDAAILDTSSNFNLIPNFVSPPQTGTGAFGGMVIVQKQWLYVAYSSQIEAYSINGAGALTAITGSPFVFSGTEAYSTATDPAGKFLFLTGANDDQVWVFAINQTNGSLTTVGSFSTGFFAAEVTTDGLGKFLYVTAGNLGSEVAVFVIGSTGSLTPVVGSPFPISIAQLQGEPTGKFLLGITGDGANNGFCCDNNIYVYSINQSSNPGALTLVVSSPTTYTPATLAVHPNGTLVYTFNQTVTGTSPMEGFQFNTTTGALSPLASSPFTAITAPAGTFDQSGAYLFMRPGTTLTAASVDTTTGALTSIGTPITSAGNPVTGSWAATDPH